MSANKPSSNAVVLYGTRNNGSDTKSTPSPRAQAPGPKTIPASRVVKNTTSMSVSIGMRTVPPSPTSRNMIGHITHDSAYYHNNVKPTSPQARVPGPKPTPTSKVVNINDISMIGGTISDSDVHQLCGLDLSSAEAVNITTAYCQGATITNSRVSNLCGNIL